MSLFMFIALEALGLVAGAGYGIENYPGKFHLQLLSTLVGGVVAGFFFMVGLGWTKDG